MRCPACSSTNHHVLDSRPEFGYIRRRRECKDCNSRFTTEERNPLLVLSRKDRTCRTCQTLIDSRKAWYCRSCAALAAKESRRKYTYRKWLKRNADPSLSPGDISSKPHTSNRTGLNDGDYWNDTYEDN